MNWHPILVTSNTKEREVLLFFVVFLPRSGLPQKAHPKTMLPRMGLLLATIRVSMPLPSPRRLMDHDNPLATAEYKKKCVEIRSLKNVQREILSLSLDDVRLHLVTFAVLRRKERELDALWRRGTQQYYSAAFAGREQVQNAILASSVGKRWGRDVSKIFAQLVPAPDPQVAFFKIQVCTSFLAPSGGAREAVSLGCGNWESAPDGRGWGGLLHFRGEKRLNRASTVVR